MVCVPNIMLSSNGRQLGEIHSLPKVVYSLI